MAGASGGERPLDVFLAGARFIVRHPALRTLTVLLTALSALIFGVNDVLIYHLKHDLGQTGGAVGYVLAAGIAGTLSGSAVVARVRRRFGFAATWIGAWALCGPAVAAVGLADRVPVVAVAATGVLFCTGVAGIASMSLRQEVTPPPLLGRVTSAFWTMHASLAPVGATVLTAAAAGFGAAATLAVAGALCTAIALSALLTPLRKATAVSAVDPDT